MNSAINVQFTDESKRLINKLADVGKFDLTPVLALIGVAYRKSVKAIFDHKEPRDADMAWAPLSEQYSAWKAKKYGSDKVILRATDRLYNSMTQESNPENISIISKTGAVFGSKVPYGIYHDALPASSHKKMPFRNFSIPGERSINSMLKTLNSAVCKQFEREGFHVQEAILND